MSRCQEAKPLVPTDMGQGSAWPWMESSKVGAGFEPPVGCCRVGPGGVLPANPAGWLGLSKQGQPCSPTHQRACASEGTSVEQPNLADVVRVPMALPMAWPSCHMEAGAEGMAPQVEEPQHLPGTEEVQGPKQFILKCRAPGPALVSLQPGFAAFQTQTGGTAGLASSKGQVSLPQCLRPVLPVPGS